MFEIGRLCVKIAGRDAGLRCVVVGSVDDTFVLVDGQTRRRKVNIKHLEPLDKVLSIESGASHEDVAKALSDEGIAVEEKKHAPKEKKEAPSKKPAAKSAQKTKKPAKKAAKSE
jgi:large subunit ribosomal protein L14e